MNPAIQTATLPHVARERAPWRAVAIPSEHGGWSLTAEPVLLGLVIAPSSAGVALSIAAFVAFVVRTPLKTVLVDRWRNRWLPRSRVAAYIAVVELAILLLLALTAVSLSGWAWLVPVAIAAPLVGIELWFDMRSRSRRLIPELCGAVGIAAVAASVALAGGADARLAFGLWFVLSARSIGTIPFVRLQIARVRHATYSVRVSDRAQVAGAVVAAAAVAIEPAVALGALAVGALLIAQVIWVRRPAVPAKVLGLRQLGLGLGVVAVTAAGVLA